MLMTNISAHVFSPANVTAWITGINKPKEINNEPYTTAQLWVALEELILDTKQEKTSHWEGCDD